MAISPALPHTVVFISSVDTTVKGRFVERFQRVETVEQLIDPGKFLSGTAVFLAYAQKEGDELSILVDRRKNFPNVEFSDEADVRFPLEPETPTVIPPVKTKKGGNIFDDVEGLNGPDAGSDSED